MATYRITYSGNMTSHKDKPATVEADDYALSADNNWWHFAQRGVGAGVKVLTVRANDVERIQLVTEGGSRS